MGIKMGELIDVIDHDQGIGRGLEQDFGRCSEINFLLGWDDSLFAHCSTQLWYIIRQAPFSVAHLADADLSIDFAEVTAPDDRVVVIATQPLTDNERWTAFGQGELLAFRDGARLQV